MTEDQFIALLTPTETTGRRVDVIRDTWGLFTLLVTWGRGTTMAGLACTYNSVSRMGT